MQLEPRCECLASRAWVIGVVLLGLGGCGLLTPVPPMEPGANPFEGRSLYMNPWSRAGSQAERWRRAQPEDAMLMDQLAAQPVSLWFGDWTANVESTIRTEVERARSQGALALMVLYNIPDRDCGLYSTCPTT